MRTQTRALLLSMLGAAAITAQLVAGKATRDALFLTSLDFTALPMMLVVTSICSILLVAAHAKATRHTCPAISVPVSFILSGLLFFVEWMTRSTAPSATAILVYLHISASGPLLASGFWLIATERFDPRTAKRRFGQIAGAGTLGGLLGALLSERVAALWGAPDMLLFLGVLHVLTAGLVRLVAAPPPGQPIPPESVDDTPVLSRSGLRVIADAPHLQHLAALVLFGTTSAALLEYLFKARVVQTFGPGDNLLRFFALYYAATSVVTFVLQSMSSRAVLEKFGLGVTSSSPSIALLAGSIGGLIAPGFTSLLVARSAESIFRGSWFRTGYELFYTPIPAAEKRAAKSVIDVAFDRLGDAVGGGLVRVALMLAPAAQSSTILSLAMVSSVGAIVAASRLNHWYIRTLENSLVRRGSAIDLSDTEGEATRRLIVDVRRRNEAGFVSDPGTGPVLVDPELQDILSLRSGDHERVINVLSRQEGLTAGLIPHAIPLLAEDALADYALFALRKVAEEHVGELSDALLDPAKSYMVRRRLARVFSICVSQRATDAVLLALDDERFDVRFQAARSLAAIRDKNPRVHIDRERIESVVLNEVAVGGPVWESQRLLDGFVSSSPLDEFVRDRSGQSLAHVFTLLSLVLPRDPLQIAFRSLHSNDRQLRGTALEYLEQVLPPQIRQGLWPFLVSTEAPRQGRKHDEIIADLLRSSESITLRKLASLRAE
jgi:ATP:ADP antiporter, AAA family